MVIAIDKRPEAMVVTLGGRADFEAVGPLRETLQKLALTRPGAVVFSAAGLEFIGSGAIGVLVEFRKGIVKAGGRVAIASANEYVANCFRLSRLDAAFEMRDSLDEAVAAMKPN